MPADDDSAGRAPPRFVPTLTEVVAPGDEAPAPSRPAPLDLARPAAEPPAPAATPGTGPSLEQIADAVLARLGPQLERQIADTIGRVLHEQLLGLNGRVHKAVAELVREAVARDIARHANGADDGGYP